MTAAPPLTPLIYRDALAIADAHLAPVARAFDNLGSREPQLAKEGRERLTVARHKIAEALVQNDGTARANAWEDRGGKKLLDAALGVWKLCPVGHREDKAGVWADLRRAIEDVAEGR